MKHRAASHLPVVLALLLSCGHTAAQDRNEPRQFYGSPQGWTIEAEGAVASTSIFSTDANGFILFHCSERVLGFHIALSAEDIDQPSSANDGLLQIYPALTLRDDSMLAHFTVRFRGPDALHSTRFRHPGGDGPARLLQLVRDYPTGLRLHAIPLHHNRIKPAWRIDLHLPGIANGDGVPMEIALAVVEETCRRPR